MDDVTITLNREDYETLLFALGYATGAAFKQRNERMAENFVTLANTINKNNPNWLPYVFHQTPKGE